MALSARAVGLTDNLEDGTDSSDVTEERRVDPEDAWWLETARQALADSVTYFDTAHREQIERNIDNFHSKHPKKSKYYRPEYSHRSRLFLPKIHAMILRLQAAGTAAFFSTEEVTHITAANEDNPEEAAGADLWHSILEHRLSHDIKWFLTLVGALQDAATQGICISAQKWDFREDGDGDVTHDRPAVDLIPVERFHFSPTADWRDVVNDSEYLIEDMPMTVARVKERMRAKEWKWCEDSVIAASRKPRDGTKVSREKDKGDKEQADTVTAHMTAHVHKIILRHEGLDYTWYTLGTEHMLTRPTRLKDVTPGGARLYAVGGLTVESHAPIPQAMAELLQDLQAEANHIKNDRRDNVSLVLSPRMLLDSDSHIDSRSLSMSVPGGVITGRGDMSKVVSPLIVPDVTASGHAEEDRNNAAIDEIAGSFNPSSINTNRNMGDTATGMELLAADSNVMTEFHLEIFATTWVEPVLQQLLLLEQAYEDDFTIFADAAKAADIVNKHRQEYLTPGMKDASLSLTVKVGVDATNPERRGVKLGNLMTVGTNLGVPLDGPALFREFAGTLGFASGQQFIVNPEEQPEQPPDPALQIEQAKLEADGAKAQAAQMKVEQDGQIQMQRLQLDAQKAQQVYELAVQRAELDLQREQIKAQMQQLGIQSAEEIALMQDRTTRESAMLAADTSIQSSILQGQTAQAIAAQRDQLDREKTDATMADQREARTESNSIAREGLFAKAQQDKARQAETPA